MTNYGKRPVRTEIVQYSQFGLDLDGYRDNNNYVRHNFAETADFRYEIYSEKQKFSFIEVSPAPVWYSKNPFFST